MMRSINYLKIICDCNAEQRAKFEAALKETQLISVFVDEYKDRVKDKS